MADAGCSEGRHYLEVDPRITCDFSDPKWTEMFLISLLGIVLYVVGIPVHFFYKLFRARPPRVVSAARLNPRCLGKRLQVQAQCPRRQAGALVISSCKLV